MRLRSCLLAVLATVIGASAVLADNPFEKFIPRGRLLRKLRDDIIGVPDPKPAEPSANADRRTPTPAVPPRGAQPTPARPPQQLQPSQTDRTAAAPAQQRTSGKGFGMLIQADRNDQIVITQVTPGGNAAAAGLARGDVIVSAGGVKLGSLEEYREITKILGQGDQLDFEISRRGRKGKVTVQHGQPPQLDDVEETAGPTGRNGGAVSGSRSGDVSPDRPQKPYRGDFEFVPPAADDSVSGMRSVLDSPIVNYRGPSAAKARSAAHVPARSMSMNRAMDSMRSQPRPTLESGPQQRGNSSQQRQVQQRRLEWLRQQQVIGSGVRR